MELLSLKDLSLGGVIAGMASIVIEAEFELLAKWLTRYRATYRIGFGIINNFYFRTIFFIILSILLFLFIKALQVYLHLLLFLNAYFVGALTYGFSSWIAQSRFARIGLHSAQLSVKSGTNYARSLDLCREKFSFLGTGASKLTSSNNFSSTLARCNNTNASFRFLLSKPDNKIIASAERMAGVASTQYAINILESLKRLAAIKKARHAAIEVRFYPAEKDTDFEDFRMMFVDDKFLLLSINAYGRGDGSASPQVVLRKATFSNSE